MRSEAESQRGAEGHGGDGHGVKRGVRPTRESEHAEATSPRVMEGGGRRMCSRSARSPSRPRLYTRSHLRDAQPHRPAPELVGQGDRGAEGAGDPPPPEGGRGDGRLRDPRPPNRPGVEVNPALPPPAGGRGVGRGRRRRLGALGARRPPPPQAKRLRGRPAALGARRPHPLPRDDPGCVGHAPCEKSLARCGRDARGIGGNLRRDHELLS